MGNYQLQVTIDQESGFCFGVVYAIDMAEEILAQDGFAQPTARKSADPRTWRST